MGHARQDTNEVVFVCHVGPLVVIYDAQVVGPPRVHVDADHVSRQKPQGLLKAKGLELAKA